MREKLLFISLCIGIMAASVSAQIAASKPKDLGLLNGKARTLPKPVYPQAAVKSKATGVVMVIVTVDEQGNVISATSNFENVLLRDAAIAAARQAKFEPYIFQGKARKVTGKLIYQFMGPPADDYFDMSDFMDYLDKSDNNYLSLFGIMNIPDQVENGKYDEAIKTLDPLIAGDPKEQWGLGFRALAYYGKGDMARALADANAAIAIKPQNTRALNVRALVELKNGQSELAKRDFDLAIAASTDAITKRPGSMDDYFARAETYRLMGENEKAAADYRKTLELAPKYQFAEEHLALVAGKANQSASRGETDAELKTRFEGLIQKNNALGTAYDVKRTALMSLQASGVTGSRLCQPLADFSKASQDLDPVLNDLININGSRLAAIASARQMAGLKEVLKWRAEKYLPNVNIIKNLQTKNGCLGGAGAAAASGTRDEFRKHLDEFEQQDILFGKALKKADVIDKALQTENEKNGRPAYTKPADNTAICSALSEADAIYSRLFAEYDAMTLMKESGALDDHHDLLNDLEDADEEIEGLGGSLMTRQMIWGCKTK